MKRTKIKKVNNKCSICELPVDIFDRLLRRSVSDVDEVTKYYEGVPVEVVTIDRLHKVCVVKKILDQEKPKSTGTIPDRYTSDPRYSKPTLPKGYGSNTGVIFKEKDGVKIKSTNLIGQDTAEFLRKIKQAAGLEEDE